MVSEEAVIWSFYTSHLARDNALALQAFDQQLRMPVLLVVVHRSSCGHKAPVISAVYSLLSAVSVGPQHGGLVLHLATVCLRLLSDVLG